MINQEYHYRKCIGIKRIDDECMKILEAQKDSDEKFNRESHKRLIGDTTYNILDNPIYQQMF